VDRARDLFFAGARLALDEHAQVLRRDALERREELAHRRRLADERAERSAVALLCRSCRAIDVEAKGGASDDDLRARREHGFDDAMPAEPRAVRRARVANMHALAVTRELEVHSAHSRIGEHQIVRLVTPYRRERLREREGRALPGTLCRRHAWYAARRGRSDARHCLGRGLRFHRNRRVHAKIVFRR